MTNCQFVVKTIKDRIIMRNSIVVIAYFFSLALMGALLLALPGAWNGANKLSFIDTAFTAASAVCVTGLITVDTANFSLMGKTIILFLIQMGGLGIITFTTLLLLLPGRRISFNNRRLIKNFYVEDVEHEPKIIVRNILYLTVGIELAGTLILYTRFKHLPGAWFISLFHAVSAFCNAGFSTFSNSLENWNNDPWILTTISFLVISGGISFVVIHDIFNHLSGDKPKLSIHTRVVLLTTMCLLIGGTLFYYWNENDSALKSFSPFLKLLNSFFHSVTPRTAGFNSLPMDSFSPESNIVAITLMFIGAAPGSMAGGIKVTTLFLILLALFRGIDDKGDTMIFHRKIPGRLVSHAGLFFIKALFLLCLAIFLLSLSERQILRANEIEIFDLIFEVVSAFGTVGLSLVTTGKLSSLGKVIIIATMLSGRIGLIFMASQRIKQYKERLIEYPQGEVHTG